MTRRSICIGKVYTAHNCLIFSYLNSFIHFILLIQMHPKIYLICRMFNKTRGVRGPLKVLSRFAYISKGMHDRWVECYMKNVQHKILYLEIRHIPEVTRIEVSMSDLKRQKMSFYIQMRILSRTSALQFE